MTLAQAQNQPGDALTLNALAEAVPVIRTERLIMRAPSLADLPVMTDYFTGPRSGGDGGPMTPAQVEDLLWRGCGQWLLRGYGQWHVDDAETGELIGRIGVYHPSSWPEAEIAWAIMAASAEGRGIAYEAARAARQAAADLWGLTRPISTIRADNIRSQNLARRMGAFHEGDRETIYGPMQTWRHPETLPETQAHA